ncbi:HIT family protein [Candidatus Micrarchaeota archaeon]|nr:HIT family protein [Candidatus Micrarchaeota archaeon]
MGKCAFCSVAASERYRVVFEDELALCVLDKYPLVEGHCLIVPKRHAEHLGELGDEELLGLMKAVVKAEKALLALKLGDGVDLRQHYRPFLAESELKVNHVHFHLLPRRHGDALFEKSLRHEMSLREMNYDRASVGKLAKAISKAAK